MEKLKIIAAGGLVTNDKGALLLIFRRGCWDLPKGKLDEGETIEACAVREVREETGLVRLQPGALIGITHHEYYDKWSQQDVLKETHWYAMEAIGEQQLVPQREEDIEQILWADREQVADYMQETYPNIVEIVEKFGFYKKG